MAVWTLTKLTGASTYAATLTAHADAHTKGSYAELTASGGAAGFYLYLGNSSAQALMFLIDIATGAAASETAVLANIHVSMGGSSGRQTPIWIYVPLRIAASSRISARCQCNVGASTIEIRLYAMTTLNVLPVYARATTYGADTADSGGVQVDPGASADTKGAYSQVSASLTNAVEYALVCVGNQGNIAETEGAMNVDLATGAAASEVVQQADLPLLVIGSTDVKLPAMMGFPIAIAATTRLAVRAQCSMNNATDRLFDVAVIGFDQQESSGSAGGGPLVGGRLAA